MPAYIAVLLKNQEENTRYTEKQISQNSLGALFQPKSCSFPLHHFVPRSFSKRIDLLPTGDCKKPRRFSTRVQSVRPIIFYGASYLYIALYVLDLDELH